MYTLRGIVTCTLTFETFNSPLIADEGYTYESYYI